MQWRSALLYYHKIFFSAYAKVPYAEVERPLILVVCGLTEYCDLRIYADDTCLGFTDKNIKTIEHNLNKNFSFSQTQFLAD